MKMGLSHILHHQDHRYHEPFLLGSFNGWQNVRHVPGRRWSPCFGTTLQSAHTPDR
jgi:hypothetical protein